MKTLLVSMLLVMLGGSAFAQSQVEFKSGRIPNFSELEHGGGKPSDAIQAIIDTTHKRPFDVLSYQLLLDWRGVFKNKTQAFPGWNTITISVPTTTDTVLLDATEMRIDTFWMNGSIVNPAPQPDAAEHLTIPVPANLRDPALPIILRFAYTRTSATNDGMNFYPAGTIKVWNDHIDTTSEDLAYTMSEPLDAHKWMPCMDLPYDKAQSQISIIVPTGITAQSNGDLLSVDHNADGSSTWNWKSDQPISTYLMVADASNFVMWTDYYHRISNPNDSVPVVYYAWPKDYYSDSLKGPYNAKAAFAKTPLMLKAFSERFGEYPFKKYGQVPVEPFLYGGMEHQSITTVNRIWLNGSYETGGIAHELMHQWFGDKTTCETWSDIWLNEGFATYGEGIWAEVNGGKASYDDYMAWKSRGYFVDTRENGIPIYNPPIDNVFDYATVYCKAGCVLYMLRKLVGNDTLFFHAMRDYSANFAYSTANTAQFADFMGRRLGIDLTEYMDQWVYGAGHPVYDIRWGQKSGAPLNILVYQTQTVRDHFTMPMVFDIYHGASIDTVQYLDDQRVQRFVIDLPYTADSVHFDSLSVVVSLHTESHDANLSVPSYAQPNPLNFSVENDGTSLECRFTQLTTGGTLQVVDLLGQVVQEVALHRDESDRQFRSDILPSGAYFIRLLTSDGHSASARISILK